MSDAFQREQKQAMDIHPEQLRRSYDRWFEELGSDESDLLESGSGDSTNDGDQTPPGFHYPAVSSETMLREAADRWIAALRAYERFDRAECAVCHERGCRSSVIGGPTCPGAPKRPRRSESDGAIRSDGVGDCRRVLFPVVPLSPLDTAVHPDDITEGESGQVPSGFISN